MPAVRSRQWSRWRCICSRAPHIAHLQPRQALQCVQRGSTTSNSCVMQMTRDETVVSPAAELRQASPSSGGSGGARPQPGMDMQRALALVSDHYSRNASVPCMSHLSSHLLAAMMSNSLGVLTASQQAGRVVVATHVHAVAATARCVWSSPVCSACYDWDWQQWACAAQDEEGETEQEVQAQNTVRHYALFQYAAPGNRHLQSAFLTQPGCCCCRDEQSGKKRKRRSPP